MNSPGEMWEEEGPSHPPRLALPAAWVGPASELVGPDAGTALSLLVPSFLLVTLLQFATPAFEAFPEASYASGVLIVTLAGWLGWTLLQRGQGDRAAVLVGIAGLAMGLTAAGCLAAKVSWSRGLNGNPQYALPANPVSYGASATHVEVRAADGVRLRATHLDNRTPYGVVLVPGWRATRLSFAIVTLATWLANDFGVLVVDPRGQGGSGGFKTPDGAERLDVLAAVSYLRARGYQRIAVVAEQDACLGATLAGAERRFEALALVGPTLTWGGGLGPSWGPAGLFGRLHWRVAGGLRLAAGRAERPLAEHVGRVAPMPLLLMGSEAYQHDVLKVLHDRAGEQASLIVWRGQARPVDWAHFAEYHQYLAQWLPMALVPPRDAEAPSPGAQAP
ncbi:MAG: hypothetical protein VKQ33_12935 [Candidatus Sericytochromatia bacterium]|nr:hypothetical protein [Candidatus Sericytochromatia bacterium]